MPARQSANGLRGLTLLAAWRTVLLAGAYMLLLGACTNGPLVVTIPDPAVTALPEPTSGGPLLLPPAPFAAGLHFGGIVFAEHITDEGQPTATSTSFAGGARQI